MVSNLMRSKKNLYTVQDLEAGGMRFETTEDKRVHLFAWEKFLFADAVKKWPKETNLLNDHSIIFWIGCNIWVHKK